MKLPWWQHGFFNFKSGLGDVINDPERFFKYDDYISHKTGTTGLDISIVEDYDRENDLRDLILNLKRECIKLGFTFQGNEQKFINLYY